MDLKLVIFAGVKEPRTLLYRTEDLIIGRQRTAALCIPSAEVSRQHCRLTVQNGYVVIEDLNSSNGSYLNGTRVTEPLIVRPNDQVDIGPIKFRVEYELSAEALAALDPPAEEVEVGEELVGEEFADVEPVAMEEVGEAAEFEFSVDDSSETAELSPEQVHGRAAPEADVALSVDEGADTATLEPVVFEVDDSHSDHVLHGEPEGNDLFAFELDEADEPPKEEVKAAPAKKKKKT